MKKYLIVFYSRTGTSKKVAKKIKQILGDEADIEEIKDEKNRKGLIGFVVSVADALKNNITRISPVKLNPASYENTIIITPVWADRPADAIRTYIAAYSTDIKSLILITCAASSGGEGVQKNIFTRFLLKADKLISLKQSDVKNDNFASYLVGIGNVEPEETEQDKKDEDGEKGDGANEANEVDKTEEVEKQGKENEPETAEEKIEGDGNEEDTNKGN